MVRRILAVSVLPAIAAALMTVAPAQAAPKSKAKGTSNACLSQAANKGKSKAKGIKCAPALRVTPAGIHTFVGSDTYCRFDVVATGFEPGDIFLTVDWTRPDGTSGQSLFGFATSDGTLNEWFGIGPAVTGLTVVVTATSAAGASVARDTATC